MYDNYASLLSYDCSDDYWDDEGIDEAVQILNKFSSSDWEDLKQNSGSKLVKWKVRCAQTLSEIKNKNSELILFQFLSSIDDDVVEAAIDSINSLLQSGFELHFNKSEIEIVTKYATSSDVISIVAKHLLHQIDRFRVKKAEYK